MKPVYLDYNATTPIDPKVAEAMLPFIHEHFGNPSSGHFYGAATKKAVENARGQVAQMLQCAPGDVVFTSGGSESNNYAIKGVAHAYRSRGNHIITSAVEHPAVLEVCVYLESNGFQITRLPVDGDAWVSPEQVEAAITPATILVSIMHANNEVGTIEPIREIVEAAHRHGVLVHTDAAQSIGKISVRVDELGIDLLSIAGHKLYAPKGVGALYIRPGTVLEKFVHGAGHEVGRRAGTENTIGVVGLGAACRMIAENLSNFSEHMRAMRDRLESGILSRISDVRVNGRRESRLPNTASISFKSLEADSIISNLPDIAVSAGSACHSDRVEISPVLKAMGIPLEYAMGTIRFSTGRFTSKTEIDLAVNRVAEVVEKLRQR